MSATNDPSAIYGLHREGREPKEPAKREPMLSDLDFVLSVMSIVGAYQKGTRTSIYFDDPKMRLLRDRLRAQSAPFVTSIAEGIGHGIGVMNAFYEAKITSGELMVVRKIVPNWNFENDPDGKWGTWECECFRRWDSNSTPDVGEFCNCGRQVAGQPIAE